MAYWLLKTEPSDYNWDDLVKAKQVPWTGVANATALIHLRAMKKNDLALIYHTGTQRQAVGIAQIVRAAYADPALDDPKRVVVDVRAKRPLAHPVTLEQIKADKAFAGWDLLRIGRLSVVPVPAAMWERVMELAECQV